MNQVVTDSALIAKCGLYCGSCKSYQKGKCPGCTKNEKAAWCKVRSCCLENNYQSCADCPSDLKACKKLNNPISKLFALVFRSDRQACLQCIKAQGYETYAKEMAEKGSMSIKK